MWQVQIVEGASVLGVTTTISGGGGAPKVTGVTLSSGETIRCNAGVRIMYVGELGYKL
jgi:hypothetical protein